MGTKYTNAVLTVIAAALCALVHFRKGIISQRIRFELSVDAQFIVLGVIATL